MLHQVAPGAPAAFEPNRILRVTPDFLDQTIRQVLEAGFDIISLDDVAARLAGPTHERPFVAFTLDDAYRDNLVHAYPVFKRYGLPFAVYGVIPNYVDRDKFEMLTWAGMNRIRMGIQSGSRAILDFYKRPTPPEKILAAGAVASSFAPKYHIPPVYDIIMDNPIETREDVVATLELLYELARPYTLLIYSLKVIPNTGLAEAMKARGIDLDQIDDSYLVVPPRAANLLLYLLVLWRPPRWLWERLLERVRASAEPQSLYPRLGMLLRTLYLTKRVLGHVRVADFSITPGRTSYFLWRLGLVRFWQRWFVRRAPRPERAVPPTALPIRVAS